MKLPEEITNNSFYFYKGYIIRLYNTGAYALYKLHVGGGIGIKDKQDQLLYCMESVDKLNKERDEKEKQDKKMAEFLKQHKPYINAIFDGISKELYKRSNDNE